MRLCSRCKLVLAKDATACPQDGSPFVEVKELPDGVRIGAYRTVRKIGEGGMGFVYEARHEVLDRRTAIKFLRPEYASKDVVVARFLQEAKAVNLINHENIISVYDYGDGSDGSVYFVMEFLEGETLAELMKRKRPLPLPILVHVFGQVLKALSAAHKKNVVHRDLKPANIFLIKREDNPYFVKLLDFGVAKLRSEGGVPLTSAGALIGTPQYMSPEQLRGVPVDARADIFSMGIMLYRAAAGQAPFKGETLGELAQKILTTEPPTPREVNKDVPAALEAIVLRALKKDPAERYPSAEEMLADLEKLRAEVGPLDDCVEEGTPEARRAGDASAPNAALTAAPSKMAASIPALQGASTVQAPTQDATPAPPRRGSSVWSIAAGVVAVAAAVVIYTQVAGGTTPTAEGVVNKPEEKPPARPDAALQVAATIKARYDARDVHGARVLAEDALNGEKGSERLVAAVSLVGSPALAPFLYTALGGAPEARRMAARGLAEMHLADAAPKVRAALNNSGDRLRVELAACLVALEDRDAIAILRRSLSDPGSRLVAARALAQAGEADAARPVLTEMIGTLQPGGEAWRIAAEGLVVLGDNEALKQLQGELLVSDAERQVAAADILARAHHAEARDWLASAAADATFGRRAEAALALARLGDKAALDFLKPGLTSLDPQERAHAIAVAARLHDNGSVAEIARLATDDEDVAVRLTAEAAFLTMTESP